MRDSPLPVCQSSRTLYTPPLTLPNPKISSRYLGPSMGTPKLIAESPIGFKLFPEVDQLHVFPGWLACITTLSTEYIINTCQSTCQPQFVACDTYESTFYPTCQNELIWRGDTARFVIFYSCIPLKFAQLPPGWRIVTHHFSHQGTLATWNLVRLLSILSSRPAQTRHSWSLSVGRGPRDSLLIHDSERRLPCFAPHLALFFLLLSRLF